MRRTRAQPRPRRRSSTFCQPLRVLEDPVEPEAERRQRRDGGRQPRLGRGRQRQRADRVLPHRRQLGLGDRQRGDPAEFVDRLEQRRPGDLGRDLDVEHQRRPEHVVVDAAVRAVGVALVLADVLRPAGGEVAAEDRDWPAAARDTARRCGSPPPSPIRSDDCTAPGRSTTSSGRAAGVGQRRRCAAGARRPSRPPRAVSTWSSTRVGEMSPTTTSTAPSGRTRSRCSARTCAAVVAATASACGRSTAYGCSPHIRRASALGGDRARARPGDGQPLDLALTLGRDLVARERRLGEHHGEQVEQARSPVASTLPRDSKPVGVDADVQVAAEALDGGGQAGAVEVAGAGEQRLDSRPARGRDGSRRARGTGSAAAPRPAARRACG